MDPSAEVERHEVKRLIALMKDPRYWRDRDPELRRTVHRGFKRLYGRGPGSGRRSGEGFSESTA